MSKTIIRHGTLITPQSAYQADLLIEGETITGIFAPDSLPTLNAQEINAQGCFVLPGLIDPHTHIQLDTGIYQTADNWEIGTKTAAYGGFTTVVDFATQYQGMDFQQSLDHRLRECAPAYIDYSLHMMVTQPIPDSLSYRYALAALRDSGVSSIKLFTTYRPNYYLDDAALLHTFQSMPDGMIAMVHCENDAIVSDATRRLLESDNHGWPYHAQSRPAIAEQEAIHRVLYLSQRTETPLYVVHCSTIHSINTIAPYRQGRVFCETCPQYFLLDSSRYTAPNPEHFILQPPLRSPEDRLQIHAHLASTDIDVIATDHCDYTLSQKRALADFTQTPGGLPGLETSLSLTFTNLPVEDSARKMQIIATKMSETPAKIFGLFPRKGTLAIGSDADIVIYDPRPTFTIHAENLHAIAGYTPYEGFQVQGHIKTVISRGRVLIQDDQFFAETGRGQFLKAKPFSPLSSW